MRLTPAQREQFDRDGYLFFPGLFSPGETRSLTDAVPALYARRDAYAIKTAHCLRWQSDAGKA